MLLGDDLVLDRVVDRLRNDLFLHELVLAFIGTVLDDRRGPHIADALKRAQLLFARRIDVDERCWRGFWRWLLLGWLHGGRRRGFFRGRRLNGLCKTGRYEGGACYQAQGKNCVPMGMHDISFLLWGGMTERVTASRRL